jgi:hypothetical protein
MLPQIKLELIAVNGCYKQSAGTKGWSPSFNSQKALFITPPSTRKAAPVVADASGLAM